MNFTEDFVQKHCRQFFAVVIHRMIKRDPENELTYLRALEEAVNTKVTTNDT